jgi:hypothetical protein
MPAKKNRSSKKLTAGKSMKKVRPLAYTGFVGMGGSTPTPAPLPPQNLIPRG